MRLVRQFLADFSSSYLLSTSWMTINGFYQDLCLPRIGDGERSRFLIDCIT